MSNLGALTNGNRRVCHTTIEPGLRAHELQIFHFSRLSTLDTSRNGAFVQGPWIQRCISQEGPPEPCDFSSGPDLLEQGDDPWGLKRVWYTIMELTIELDAHGLKRQNMGRNAQGNLKSVDRSGLDGRRKAVCSRTWYKKGGPQHKNKLRILYRTCQEISLWDQKE